MTLWLAFLLVAFIVDPASMATPQGHGSPDPDGKQTIVLVHGAWGGSWAFREVDSIMTARGYRFYRPQLTGQGERVHLASPDIDLALHIQDVVNVILYEELTDIVLVGHSYGGMVITGVADRIPERLRQLVYIDAFLPDDGQSLITLLGDNTGWIERMTRDGFVVPAWVPEGQQPPSDVPQSVKTFQQPVSFAHPVARTLPGAYILTVDEGKNADQDDFASQYARAKERGYTLYIMTADHNPEWSAPVKLADLLEQCVLATKE